MPSYKTYTELEIQQRRNMDPVTRGRLDQGAERRGQDEELGDLDRKIRRKKLMSELSGSDEGGYLDEAINRKNKLYGMFGGKEEYDNLLSASQGQPRGQKNSSWNKMDLNGMDRFRDLARWADEPMDQYSKARQQNRNNLNRPQAYTMYPKE